MSPLLTHLLTLTLWDKTSGTWINVATVLLGTAIGLLVRDNLPIRMQRIITQGLGLLTLFLGVTMANSLLKVQAGRIDGVILGLLAIVLGGLLGEWGRLEAQLQKLGDWLRDLFKGGGRFTEGFVAASLLFCVGPLAILGSLKNGLSGDNTLLSIKSTMDGLASIAFSSSYGSVERARYLSAEFKGALTDVTEQKTAHLNLLHLFLTGAGDLLHNGSTS